MKIHTLWLALLAFGATLAPAAATAQETNAIPARPPRFAGAVTVQAQAAPVEVVVRDWLIPNLRKIERLPEDGMLVVQLRGGASMTTIIDGKRAQRSQGEVWIVPAGSTMGVETGRYSVALRVLSFRVPMRGRPPG
jgi:hypothetical protein